MLGYHPEVVLPERRVNDNVGAYSAAGLVKAVIKKGHTTSWPKALLMGLTFTETFPYRNARIKDVVRKLQNYGFDAA